MEELTWPEGFDVDKFVDLSARYAYKRELATAMLERGFPTQALQLLIEADQFANGLMTLLFAPLLGEDDPSTNEHVAVLALRTTAAIDVLFEEAKVRIQAGD